MCNLRVYIHICLLRVCVQQWETNGLCVLYLALAGSKPWGFTVLLNSEPHVCRSLPTSKALLSCVGLCVCRRAGGGQGLLGPLKPARIRAVGLAMLSAVRFLHRDRLVVHHDIKPGNVLIMPDGSIKVRSQLSLLVATQLLNKKRSSAVTFPSCSSLFDKLVQLGVFFLCQSM
jgi:serine/threonine protein kinase